MGGASDIIVAVGARVRLLCLAAGVLTPIWRDGEQVAGGYADSSSDGSGAGDKLSITFKGDGVSRISISANASIGTDSSTSGVQAYIELRDGASGAGSWFDRGRFTQWGIANIGGPINLDGILAPFTGSKTIYLYLAASAGTAKMYGTDRTSRLRALWMPAKLG